MVDLVQAFSSGGLISVYIKGSFARREMQEGSDVDLVPIVRTVNDQPKAFKINGPKYLPVFCVPLSLDEFEQNRLLTPSEYPVELRALPDRFLKYIAHARLVWGDVLDPHNYPIRSNEEALWDSMLTIQNGYIPLFLAGEIDFESFLKEVFWLVELEQLCKGITPEHSFEGIRNSIEDPAHIVHKAYKYRMSELTDQQQFVNSVRAYLENLKIS